jgi:hypothetical protein
VQLLKVIELLAEIPKPSRTPKEEAPVEVPPAPERVIALAVIEPA